MTHAAQALPPAKSVARDTVTGPHRRTLEAIFQHPLSHNLAWRDVVSLISAIGNVDDKTNGDVTFRAAREQMSMTRPHDKDLAPDDVVGLRHFLTRAGWAPDGHREPATGPEDAHALGLVIVIDHQGATIQSLPHVAPDPFEPVFASHVSRELERKAPDRDPNETDPDDTRYFEQVALAAASGGRIVVIGHGKGQSREADHLSAYLRVHHKGIYGRIVSAIVADIPRLSQPELLDLGRRALSTDAGRPAPFPQA
jgi:hypothetical protein